MKKILSLLLVVLMIFAFVGCEVINNDPTPTQSQTQTPTETKTPSASESSQPMRFTGALEVYAIDVGQGDSILLISPMGKTMLVDCGDSFDKIKPVLDSNRVKKLDIVIATHPHSDHIGCMDDVINNYDIGTFYLTNVTHTTKTYESMLTALDERDVNVQLIETNEDKSAKLISWDSGVEVSVFSPVAGESYDDEDLNEWSAVVRVRYGNDSIMLTGDATAKTEQTILEYFDASDLSSTVLKVGHHGSSTSTSEAFLDAVSPKYAIISCGKDNSYGHPHRETVKALNDRNIEMLRTDEIGTIHISMSGTGVTVSSSK